MVKTEFKGRHWPGHSCPSSGSCPPSAVITVWCIFIFPVLSSQLIKRIKSLLPYGKKPSLYQRPLYILTSSSNLCFAEEGSAHIFSPPLNPLVLSVYPLSLPAPSPAWCLSVPPSTFLPSLPWACIPYWMTVVPGFIGDKSSFSCDLAFSSSSFCALRCPLSCQIIHDLGKLSCVVWVPWEAGSGNKVTSPHFRPRYVRLKVSSLSECGLDPLTLWQGRNKTSELSKSKNIIALKHS